MRFDATRRLVGLVGVAALLTAGGTVGASTVAASPAGATGACPTVDWGSLDKGAVPAPGAAQILGARAGIHDCFDRLVIDLSGQPPADWRVAYGPVHGTAGDGAIALAGGASLRISIGAPAYDPTTGGSTIVEPLPDVSGFPVFREVKFVESFEGETTYGLGVRARLPFRVFTLADPGGGSRIVIDVYEHW
jgi:hypothetical protein